MHKKFSLLSLTLFFTVTSSLYAKEKVLAQTMQSNQAATMQPMPMQPGYNQTARYNLQNSRNTNVFITGKFTYWQAIQENMELGTIGDQTSALDIINGSLVNMHFGFKPGFQVGAGVSFLPDNWDVYVEYTWFRGRNRRHVSLDTTNFLISLFPAWEVPSILSSSYFFGKENWKLRMDLIDAQLGRSYYVGEKLTFRPFVGLRAPFIRQKLRVDYTQNIVNPLLDTQIKEFSHSWGIGPRAGLELNWLLGYGIALYGKGGADITYTNYTKLHFKQQSLLSGQVQAGSRFIYNQRHLNSLRPHLDMELGFSWGTYFCNKGAHVDLSADYGFQVFFNQNMFRNFVDDTTLGKSISPNGNLYLQGLTISLRFDF